MRVPSFTPFCPLTDTPPFAQRLLSWWDEHGRHDLPWQHPRTPFRVWVSEIMLQQTQVTTVIPYFERFVQQLPDLEALARAPLDDVLALWSGLGYYARARNLHKAARICLEQHQGELPDNAETLSALPGIGQSTANAIISQAHDLPATVLDGNVRRVLARHSAVSGWPGKTTIQRQLWQIAQGHLPARRGADYTQAIMDLGATLCTRSRPGCDRCPVQMDCEAHIADAVERYPAPKPKVDVREHVLFMLIAERDNGDILLERRPAAGIWGGLWCLPSADNRADLAAQHGLSHEALEMLDEVEHRLTHRLMRIRPLVARETPASDKVKCQPDQAWYGRRQWKKLGLPRPVTDLLERHTRGDDP